MLDRGNERIANENIILKGKPNLFLSCKKVFVLLILLGAISYIAPLALNYTYNMQVYLTRLADLPLYQIATLVTYVLIFSIIIWIIWVLLSWTGKEYTISDYRVSYKSGVLFQKTIHMPYSKIQDVIVSQGILAKLVSVGTVTVYSAYDHSKLELNNVSSPKKIEETIFDEINKLQPYYPPHPSTMPLGQNFDSGPVNNYQNNNYHGPGYDNRYLPDNRYGSDNSYNRDNSYGYGNSYNPDNSYNSDNRYGSNNRYWPENNNEYPNEHYENDEKPKHVYGSINKDDFPFLKNNNSSELNNQEYNDSKDFSNLNEHNNNNQDNLNNNHDSIHDVSDYVENPEEYKNSAMFFENDDVAEENSNLAEGSNFKDNSNFNPNSNPNSDDYVDDNVYFDQTINKAINNLDGDLKFKNTKDTNRRGDNYNNQRVQNRDVDNHNNYHNPQQGYNEGNYNEGVNYNKYNDLRHIHNPSNETFENPYKNQNYPEYNRNYPQYNNYPGNNENMHNDYTNTNQNLDSVSNQNQVNSKDVHNKEPKNDEDKAKFVMERHFKKFKR